MKMMGMGLVPARWRCNSRPSMFGIETSRTTQDTFGNCGESRKPRAEVKLAAWNPIDLSRLSRASQTDASSSTIAMRASFLLLLSSVIAGIGFSPGQKPIPRKVGEFIIPWYRRPMTWCEWTNPSRLESLRHSDQLGQRSGAHFFHDLTAMNLNRDLASAQFTRDLLVEQAGDNQAHDFTLARRQSIKPLV